MKTNKTESGGFKFLAGGGEMGERIRAFDWTLSGLGPMEGWPSALLSTLSICLSAQFPMAIYWGNEGFLLYNNAWRPILGNKHPWALGRAAQEVWPEIWEMINPLFESVRATGQGTWRGDELLPMQRFGYTEECYFDYTFNPITGESGKVEGILNIVQETTFRVLSDRRTRLLSELAVNAGAAKTEQEACELAVSTMARDPADIPFALICAVGSDSKAIRLIAHTGVGAEIATPSGGSFFAESIASEYPSFALMNRGGKPVVINDFAERFGKLPAAHWPEPTKKAIALPLAATGQDAVSTVLIAGVSPRRDLDEGYLRFFELVASHVTSTLASAEAYQKERQRAEKLAELDRAKTTFFSNVSHEFRTPLTLMLGPLEDLLANKKLAGFSNERAELEVVHRNSLRLLKLVNALLDFSRLEAGRTRAVYVETDLAALTTDLASVFSSAMAQAGLRYKVECPSLPHTVFVDHDMWEKIVFNLLSNALKFTLSGEVRVSLRAEKGAAVLRVSDTGVGIPPDELPNIFKRFHRIENSRGRSHEGTGIGLALVSELVKLHEGTVEVESAPGKGTHFEARIPFGKNHLLAGSIGAATAPIQRAWRSKVFIEEASSWLSPDVPVVSKVNTAAQGKKEDQAHGRPRILLAEDNPDMRDYVQRLLQDEFDVQAVADGVAALEAAQNSTPDLILSDVMMPRLDGFGLLQKLRDDPSTRAIPIILLSARAGEEARIEGAEAGADDYLTKPFSARELLSRVRTHLKLARIRRNAEEALQEANALLADKATHLETLVQQRTGKLLDTIGELEAFSYSIAHDMRAPLRALQGFSTILLADHSGNFNADSQTYLKNIAASADRMDKLIQDVLNYSRVVRAEYPLTAVDVGHLVRGIIDTYPKMGPHDSEIVLQGHFPRVLGNEAMLMQIFSNLMGNAVKFVPPGVKPRLKLWAELREQTVHVFVQDNGIGIAADQHDKIFGIFQRVNKEFEGTGIGLAIVKKAVERMGGKVGLRSEPGQGSTFWIELRKA